MNKKKLIASVDALKEAVENDSIEGIIEHTKNFERYAKLIIVKVIESYVVNYGPMEVEYDKYKDTYSIQNTELYCNNHNAMFAPVGKLYQAYKQIKQWQNG